MKPPNTQLSKLVDMDNPQHVYDEVKTIVSMMFSEFDFKPVDRVFEDTLRLFRGKYPGYQECITGYHDLKHTTDAMLAAIRLIHGASIRDETISQEGVTLTIISSLLHDTGYILTLEDDSRSGGKYTLVHIDRSIDFMENYLEKNNFSKEIFYDCRDVLRCTGFRTEISQIQFNSPETELFGKIMGTADLLGQMADRTYLEKLPFLYHEFKEAKIESYSSVMDVFEKTPDFYVETRKRFDEELGGVNRFAIDHFKNRWNIDSDLYADAIEKNIVYLKYILKNRDKSLRSLLRRGGYLKFLGGKKL
ncbi:MAG: hypothetical protein JSU83_12870 [Deltaproteobacteria bacterium]|nr:MAG: hypothetical protein JSU83_12870 [Deltaproteobacteria bacterium]